MRDYVLLPDAKQDLEDIWVFTYHKWGIVQANRYIDRLYDRLGRLADYPEIGRPYEDSEEPCLRYHEGRHMIFYRVGESSIKISRVLHDNMDFVRHL